MSLCFLPVPQDESYWCLHRAFGSPVASLQHPQLLFFVIEAAVALVDPLNLSHKARTAASSQRTATWTLDADPAWQAEMLNLLCHSTLRAQPQTLREVLAAWGAEFPTLAFTSLAPVTVLTAHNMWHVHADTPRASLKDATRHFKRREFADASFTAMFLDCGFLRAAHQHEVDEDLAGDLLGMVV